MKRMIFYNEEDYGIMRFLLSETMKEVKLLKDINEIKEDSQNISYLNKINIKLQKIYLLLTNEECCDEYEDDDGDK